jgi:probable F420-dependent oxidoreductase
MSDRQFRFGVVAAAARSGREWAGLARRVEGLGYATLLIPDTTHTLAPLPAAAAAAGATETLQVGSYVLAAALRPPQVVAWEAATLHTVTGGRFELGLGAGRPDAEQDAAGLGLPATGPADRVALLGRTLQAVHERRERDAGGPRLLVAGAGPKVLGLAARYADTLALGLPPAAPEEQFAAKVRLLRELAGERAGQLELNLNLLAVGTVTPPWLRQHLGVDVPDLLARGALSVLAGSPREMADELERRRAAYGVSYVCVNAAFADQLAPVVELLAGR